MVDAWLVGMKRILVAVDRLRVRPAVIDAGIELARTSGREAALARAVGLPPEPLAMDGFAAPPTQVWTACW